MRHTWKHRDATFVLPCTTSTYWPLRSNRTGRTVPLLLRGQMLWNVRDDYTMPGKQCCFQLKCGLVMQMIFPPMGDNKLRQNHRQRIFGMHLSHVIDLSKKRTR